MARVFAQSLKLVQVWGQTLATSSFLWGARAGGHSAASWASPRVWAAWLRLLPVCSRGVGHLWVAFQVPPDHHPEPQAKALLCLSDKMLKDLCLLPSKRKLSASNAGFPSEFGKLLTLTFIESVSSGVGRPISLSQVFSKVSPKRLASLGRNKIQIHRLGFSFHCNRSCLVCNE